MIPIERKKTSNGGLAEASPREDLFQNASSDAVVTFSFMPVSFSNSGNSGSIALSQGCLTKKRLSVVPWNCFQSILALSGGSAAELTPRLNRKAPAKLAKNSLTILIACSLILVIVIGGDRERRCSARSANSVEA